MDDKWQVVSDEEFQAAHEYATLQAEEESRRHKEEERAKEAQRQAQLQAQYEEMLALLKEKNSHEKVALTESSSRKKWTGAVLAICAASGGISLAQVAIPDVLGAIFSSYRLGIPTTITVIAFAVYSYLKAVESSSDTFVEIDKSAELRKETKKLEDKILVLEAAINGPSYAGAEVLAGGKVEAPLASLEVAVLPKLDSYLQTLIAAHDDQIVQYEKKASSLLDKGIRYLLTGIICYVISIIVWQVVLAKSFVGDFYIVGMVSCALTFLVVEFLAAWFLRQYKGFVDASLELVRVKSVFNRYLLSYYAIGEFGDKGSELATLRAELLEVLKEPIKWTESATPKQADLNHMVALFESVAGVLGKLDTGTKKKAETDAAP